MGLPLANPDRIGRYEVVSVIGRGGMGTVYLATDPRIGRSVAIKVLASSFGNEPELLERFYREAKSTGSLQHQNIVTVYELGDQEGFPYLVMEYLEGDGLDTIISARKSLQIAEKLDILVQVCNGLNYAHKRGIIHRDIKPANIVILKSGTVKIVDFGIAQVGTSRLTRTGMVVGSIHYMSPEQISSQTEIDQRTDIYSAGVVLFQLLTGQLPFQGQDTGSTLLKIVHDPPPSLGKLLNDCPPELESIVEKALAKNRSDRYASADDFAFDLMRLQQQLSRGMLAEYIAQVSRAIEQEQFDEAKRLLMLVLRTDSQNARAKELLREVQWKLEVQKRRQQALHLLSQAREAFGNKQFETALRYVDEGLNIDSHDSELLALHAAVLKKREDTAKYSESLNRAESTFKRGDLAGALQAIEEALAVQPDEPRARALHGRIARQLEERMRQEKTAATAKQFAVAVNAVEKALADARMLLFLSEGQQALDTLDKVADQASRVPQDLMSQLQALRQEIRKKLGPAGGEKVVSRYQGSLDIRDSRVEERPVPRGGTMVSPPAADASATSFLSAGPGAQQPPVTAQSVTAEYLLGNEKRDEVSDELLEFLPQKTSAWSRGTLWMGVAIAVLAVVGGWLVFVPRTGNSAKSRTSPAVTYAEIDAGPWGTVREVTSADGKSVAQPNEQTPLRLILPPGRYTVSISGPHDEQRQLEIEVPRQDGNVYFVPFAKPDVDRIISAQ